MFYPCIFKAVFGNEDNTEFTSRDAAINSDLLRAAIEIMNPKWNSDMGCFDSAYNWRVRIADQHHNEAEPHYELEFGEGGTDPEESRVKISIPYCDNWSTPDREIKQNPGTFVVEVSGSFGQGFAHHLAVSICVAYEESLRQHFPDFYILCDLSKAFD